MDLAASVATAARATYAVLWWTGVGLMVATAAYVAYSYAVRRTRRIWTLSPTSEEIFRALHPRPRNFVHARATLGIAALLVAVFAVEVIVYRAAGFETWRAWFQLSPTWNNWPVTLVSNVFAHLSGAHLMWNLVPLILTGWWVEETLGRFEFATFFVAAGIVSSALQEIAIGGNLNGASGACLAILGYWTAVTPGFSWADPPRFMRRLRPPIRVEPVIRYGLMALMLAYSFLFLWVRLHGMRGLVGASGAVSGDVAHVSGYAFGLIVGIVVSRRIRQPQPAKATRPGPPGGVRLWL